MGHCEMLLAVAGLDDKAIVERTRRLASGDWSGFPAAEQVAFSFARKQALNPKMVNINEVLIEFRDFLMPALTGSIRVEFDISSQQAIVNLDAAHFQAALLNLVVNARDAMPDGGLITVSASKVSLDSGSAAVAGVRGGDFVAVAVEDNGEGMSPEALERAFEPYFTTKGSKGTGVGLATVRAIVTSAGGRFEVDSTPQRGSRIRVVLPREGHAGKRDVAERLPAQEQLGDDEQAERGAEAQHEEILRRLRTAPREERAAAPLDVAHVVPRELHVGDQKPEAEQQQRPGQDIHGGILHGAEGQGLRAKG